MKKDQINNAFYDSLDDLWLGAEDHPIALLRAENKVRNPWIAKKLKPASTLLDIGCGGGLLTNFLAKEGHKVHGIDLSEKSLEVAAKQDTTQTVKYLAAPAEKLPYPDAYFDAVTAMDLLEHVQDPRLVIQEACRVLKPGGLFFFHTFNRNFLSWLFVIKGVELFVANAPKHMHVYPLFIKPKELKQWCKELDLNVEEMIGLNPRWSLKSLYHLLRSRHVTESFQFRFTTSLHMGYCGMAVKGF